MRKRLERLFASWGRALALRHPELYLLRVHWIALPVLTATVLAAADAMFSALHASDRSLPNIEERTYYGLFGALTAALAWAYVVARDGRRLWPPRAFKRYGVMLITFSCLTGLTCPVLAHSYLLGTRISKLSLVGSEAYAAYTATRFIHDFDSVALAVALAGVGVVLALLIVARETSIALTLSTLACFAVYTTIVAAVLNNAKLFGAVAAAHWAACALLALIQWWRRSSSWLPRINGVLLALMAPFIFLVGALAVGSVPNAWNSALSSYAVYLVLFPFLQGNLVRLRYLPA